MLAKQAETTAYNEAYNWVLSNEVDLQQVLTLFDEIDSWPEGEFDLVDVYSNIQIKKSDRVSYARRVEQTEEARIQQIIRAEIGANLSTTASWQTRRGTMNGRRMEQNFEQRLYEAADEGRALRRKRAEMGLNDQDIEERVKAHRYIEVMLELLQKVEARPTPVDGEPHHELGLRLDAVLLCRRNLDRAARELTIGTKRVPRD